MSDLLEILSRNAPCDHADINVSKVFAEAKAEIERLRERLASGVEEMGALEKANAKLREQLADSVSPETLMVVECEK